MTEDSVLFSQPVRRTPPAGDIDVELRARFSENPKGVATETEVGKTLGEAKYGGTNRAAKMVRMMAARTTDMFLTFF